ncbi:MAG TPA: VOC family protein [Chryseosolibacter sp.]|nr:VOC family protein [Chryseosolibacter sp.]
MKLHKLSPILWTKDLPETVRFYENVLGFRSRSNFPDFASLTREEVEIMFIVPQPDPEDCNTGGEEVFFPKPVLTGSLFITTEEVDKLWEFVKDKATVKSPIANREYLMRDFSILDVNGYELVFGQDISNYKIRN